jgi:hypothetical protein
MLNPQDLEKAKLVQLGLTQFEALHMAIKDPDAGEKGEEATIICGTCDVDFPCERMLSFMLMQSIAAFSAMMPTGNMGNVLARFGGGQKK